MAEYLQVGLYASGSSVSFSLLLPVCTNLELGGASALKAPSWSPWTDNDCAASLLSTTQALHAVVPASSKHSLHNRASFLDFNGPAPLLSAPKCRETDPTHDWQRNSITGRVPRSKLSQFHNAQTGIVQVANHYACREVVPHEI